MLKCFKIPAGLYFNAALYSFSSFSMVQLIGEVHDESGVLRFTAIFLFHLMQTV
eukprot:00955.XXX_555_716_1 [CDS] Oithona nana genome sequencing.